MLATGRVCTVELLGLMRGSAEVSAGGSDEMARLQDAFAKDADASAIVASDGEPEEVLARLRSLGGEAGAAVSGYLDLVGYRIVDGFDIAEPSALELPGALLGAIRIVISGEAQAASDVDARTAEIRAQVPAVHQDRFDELLGEARLTYPASRRAWRLQRYLGVGADASRRPRSRQAGREGSHFRGRSYGRRRSGGDVRPSGRCPKARRRTSSRSAPHTDRPTLPNAPPFLGPPAPPPPDLAALRRPLAALCARLSSPSATSSKAPRRRTNEHALRFSRKQGRL